MTNCFEIQTYHFEIHSVVRSKDGVLSQTNQATRPPTTCWVHTTADMPARWHTLFPSYEEFSFSILIIAICLCAHYSLIPRPSVTEGLGMRLHVCSLLLHVSPKQYLYWLWVGQVVLYHLLMCSLPAHLIGMDITSLGHDCFRYHKRTLLQSTYWCGHARYHVQWHIKG